MNKVVLILALVLLVLHQDFWFWEDSSLIFGFLPVGLGYHALYSILAASLWAFAIKFAWPHHLEALAEDDAEAPAPAEG